MGRRYLKCRSFAITMSNFCGRFVQVGFSKLPVSISILSVFALSATPSLAADDAFAGCVSGLIDKGIETSRAAAACGASRFPGELGACVTSVNRETGIASEDALAVCERTRRPDEVASCTIRIHDSLLTEPSVKALEHCGRSLLPERYATCVVDLSDTIDLAFDESLSSCIRAGYRPWEIEPRF